MAHGTGGAVPVVRHGLYQNGNAAGAVAFISNGFVVFTGACAGGLLQYALNVIVGHIRRSCLGDDGSQTGVIVGVRAAALFDRYNHFLGDLGKGRGALCVLRALGFLNVMPLGMSGHERIFPSIIMLFSVNAFDILPQKPGKINCFCRISCNLHDFWKVPQQHLEIAPRVFPPDTGKLGFPCKNAPRQ